MGQLVRKTGALAAALCLAALLAAPPVRGELRILSPPDGAVLADARVPLIGSGSTGRLEVSLNGQKVGEVGQVGKAFTGMLNLVEGKNVLTVRSGEERREVRIVRDPAAKDTAYRYHDPVVGGRCKECHPLGVGRAAAVEAKLCRACHDPKDGEPYLHGPIGAGQCTICHDPHGGSRKAFLVAATQQLCISCHDENRSKEHEARAVGRQCPECHDPHGSKKKYLLY
jgi:predicted CXXCH cytochrome family protein